MRILAILIGGGNNGVLKFNTINTQFNKNDHRSKKRRNDLKAISKYVTAFPFTVNSAEL